MNSLNPTFPVVLIDLPLPRSNEDHLEMFSQAGERLGAWLAEQVAGNLRTAAKCGLKGASISKYLEALSSFGMSDRAREERERLQALGVGLTASYQSGQFATALGDIQFCCRQDLERRGYRETQVARFKLCAWRAFKMAIRETLKVKVH